MHDALIIVRAVLIEDFSAPGVFVEVVFLDADDVQS